MFFNVLILIEHGLNINKVNNFFFFKFDDLQENLEVHKEQIRNYLSTINEQNERLQQQDDEINDLAYFAIILFLMIFQF